MDSSRYNAQPEKKPFVKWVFVALFIFMLIVPLQVATQYLAHQFNYQQSLGANFAGIYPFWSCLTWYPYTSAQPELKGTFEMAYSIGMLTMVLWLFMMLFIRAGMDKKQRDYAGIHGTSHWITDKEMKKAGLLKTPDSNKPAVVIGGYETKDGKLNYLLHQGGEHILATAPTRSGKGLALVLPTLLTWTHSTIVSDLKGELWELTAGWRKQHANNRVLRFNPASSDNDVLWNPLEEIRIGTDYEIGDAQNLALIIVDADGKGLSDHWAKTSYSLLTGVVLHVIYKGLNSGGEYKATLGKIAEELSNPSRPPKELWQEMVNNTHKNGERLDIVAQAGQDMLQRPDDEGGSVLSTLKTSFDLYRDPIVTRNTEKCSFKMDDLMNGDKPVSLYLVTEQGEKDRLKPLIRIFVSMAIRLTAKPPTFKNNQPVYGYKYKLLYMWDELPAYGKIPILEESISYVAGSGLRFYLITQDRNQLEDRVNGYGENEKITANSHIEIFYATSNIKTAEYISRRLGKTTVKQDNVSNSNDRFALAKGSSTASTAYVQRDLMTAGEVTQIEPAKKEGDRVVKAGAMLICIAGQPPIYGRQSLYFMNPSWKARSEVPSPKYSDAIR